MRTTLTTRTTPTTATARRPVAALAVGAALALALAACGSTTSSPTASSSSASSGSASTAVSPTAQSIDATHNDADVTFINDMAPHHSGAIAMAQLAAGQAGSAQVKDLARRISAAQGPEIEQMKAMAAAWKVTLNTDAGAMTGMSGMTGTTGMTGIPGMTGTAAMPSSGDDVGALGPLTGAAFDKEFLTRMTAHHMSAVMMAQTESAQGTNPQAKQLASSIVTAQQKEIAEMAGLLKSA